MSGQRISKTGCAIVMAIGVLLVGPLSGPVTAAPDREHFSDGLETQAVAQAVDMQQGPPRENQGIVGAESNHEGDVGVIPVEGYEATYNQGVAHYRSGQYTEARDFFTRSTGVSDRHLEAKARFNLANCDYAEAVALAEQDSQAAIEKLETAISHYRGALDANAGDADSRANAELARMLIERLREQQEQQQQQQDQEQEDQDQEQQEQQQDQEQEGQDQEDQQQQDQEQQDQQQQDQEQEGQDQEDQQSQDQQQQDQQQARTRIKRVRSKRVRIKRSQEQQQDQEQEGQEQAGPGASRVRSKRVRSKRVRSKRVRSKRTRSKRVRSKRVRSKRVRSKRVRSKRVRSKRVRSKRVRSSRIQRPPLRHRKSRVKRVYRMVRPRSLVMSRRVKNTRDP